MTMRSYFSATLCLAALTLSAPATACSGSGCNDRAADQTDTSLPAKDGSSAVSGGRSGGAISGGKTVGPSDDKLDDTILFDIDKFSGYDRFEMGTRCSSNGRCDRTGNKAPE